MKTIIFIKPSLVFITIHWGCLPVTVSWRVEILAILGTCSHESLRVFSVPHLLWHMKFVFNGHLKGHVSLTPVADRLAFELLTRSRGTVEPLILEWPFSPLTSCLSRSIILIILSQKRFRRWQTTGFYIQNMQRTLTKILYWTIVYYRLLKFHSFP